MLFFNFSTSIDSFATSDMSAVVIIQGKSSYIARFAYFSKFVKLQQFTHFSENDVQHRKKKARRRRERRGRAYDGEGKIPLVGVFQHPIRNFGQPFPFIHEHIYIHVRHQLTPNIKGIPKPNTNPQTRCLQLDFILMQALIIIMHRS